PTNAAERVRLYGDDDRCRAQVFRAVFRDGYSCERCGDRDYRWLPRYHLECCGCQSRRSLLTGTIFEQTKKTLIEWFKVMDYLRRHAVTASRLAERFDFNYKTALLWLDKLRIVMGGMITKTRPTPVDEPRRLSRFERLLEERRGTLVMNWHR